MVYRRSEECFTPDTRVVLTVAEASAGAAMNTSREGVIDDYSPTDPDPGPSDHPPSEDWTDGMDQPADRFCPNCGCPYDL